MTSSVPKGLLDWCALDGPSAVLDVVRRRAELGQSTETGRLGAVRLTVAQRREVGRLLGTTWALSDRPLQLRDVAARLREHGLTVLELVERVRGPIELEADVRRTAVETADTEDAAALAELVAAGVPVAEARTWLDEDRSLPVLGSGRRLGTIWEVAAVWCAAPGRGAKPVRLAQLASVHLGDAHALDADQTLGKLVARLAATVHGLERPTRGGKAWRLAWAAIGILCDEVSSRVLALNLHLTGDSHVARLCRESIGEPMWLTLRSLRGDWTAEPGTVFVCENPTVAEAAADTLGADCPPLICTDGTATTAAVDLVGGLAAIGCDLHIRADFDAAGLVIVNQLLAAAPDAKPWRFDTPTYLSHFPSATTDVTDLRTALTHLGTTIHEETLLEDLLTDLRAHAAGRPHR
ncbi:uncharacterized protein (TIGR02679 family) [Kribbella steppae]|uniref:Uncharacterized protein (TIGR02679 family) n=1 Tax=Kribbella steppae TaxID=2512223 RepID=A0A4V2RXU0_9ACTN|nr:DUF2399 domain-containing protein [Kribbella steppae]TCO15658.1 uncharacterized protein (TIGR02679 family) [Kribbella steppae]